MDGNQPNEKNIAVRIMYDGTNYHGWQRQKNAFTVQQHVEEALSETIGRKISVVGCSRTDSGVHALDYVFNFKSDTKIPADRLPYALNYRLNDDVTALEAFEVDMDFNARFSSKGKRYIYRIWNSAMPNPFESRYSWFFPYKLDRSAMIEAAGYFCGRHDFRGFMATGGQQNTTVRNVRVCSVEEDPERRELITATVEADAFLYNMVRIITGTIVEAGLGKIRPGDIPDIIESGDRVRGGITAPPQGLFLKKYYF